MSGKKNTTIKEQKVCNNLFQIGQIHDHDQPYKKDIYQCHAKNVFKNKQS